jgi:hypothetical protein
MAEVIALLDKPSPDSMGALPFVWRDEDGSLAVFGLAETSGRTVSQDEIEDLTRARQAMAVHLPLSSKPTAAKSMAMWIGKRFTSKAAALGVPAPPRPSELSIQLEDGSASIAPTDDVHARLEAWLERAFQVCITTSNRQLAELMAQVMPDHELTQAALWKTAPANQKNDELAWFVRLRRDAGKRTNAHQLERRFRALCGAPPWGKTKLTILISGRAGSGHREFAQDLALRIAGGAAKLALVSFGEFLRADWKATHHSEPTKRQLQDLGQAYVASRPFSFARQVLLQKTTPTPDVLIVDGVRHESIKDAIEFMVPSQFLPLAVDMPQDLLVRSLSQQVGPRAVQSVQEHQTEVEVRKLIAKVPTKISYNELSERRLEADKASQMVREELAEAI